MEQEQSARNASLFQSVGGIRVDLEILRGTAAVADKRSGHEMYLLANYLVDPEEYAEAEKLWVQTWGALIERLGQQKQWRVPWFENKFGNDKPCLDGNPIFTALDLSRRLTVRIIQGPRGVDGEPDFTFWTDKFAKGDPEELDELVIACVLSDETLVQATGLMTKWALQEPSMLHLEKRGSGAHRALRCLAGTARAALENPIKSA